MTDFTWGIGVKAHVEVPLTRGYVALVDVADAESVLRHRWHAKPHRRTCYARRGLPRGAQRHTEPLHRFLTGWPYVDHINGDGLDNRRANLRPATPAQNSAHMRRQAGGTSRFKGVSWYARDGIWVAMIHPRGQHIYLGRFREEEDAARAYDAAARKHYGEFAQINFPEPGEVAPVSEGWPAATSPTNLAALQVKHGIAEKAAQAA